MKKNKEIKYIVLRKFKDLEDKNRIYDKNDIFDHTGKSKERLKELSTNKNKAGRKLIREQE